jgi:hypothetical protein
VGTLGLWLVVVVYSVGIPDVTGGKFALAWGPRVETRASWVTCGCSGVGGLTLCVDRRGVQSGVSLPHGGVVECLFAWLGC